MKKRHMWLINSIFIVFIMLSCGVVYQFFTGKQPLALLSSFNKSEATEFTTSVCSNAKPINGLTGAENASLRKLNNYQKVCQSTATNTLMVFLSMPSTSQEGVDYAQSDAKVLKEFGRYKIRPLVIIEPSSKEGELLDFSLFANGTYSPGLESYFTELKKQGVTDAEMGIWNPFPEANLPYWKNNQTQYFAPAVIRHLELARKYFPQVNTSIMLNSATYDSSDFNWENGDYVSLLQYVKGIPSGLVTYAGLQGFPWVSRAENGATIFNAAEFLNPDLLMEMADQLGTKSVWYNTGTFGLKYTLDATQTKTISPEQRKQILMTVREQAKLLQKKHYQVAINIFAQDKSHENEETDWSYWINDQTLQSQDAAVLTDFMRMLHDDQITVWLFDR